jgi:hypothetical protein
MSLSTTVLHVFEDEIGFAFLDNLLMVFVVANLAENTWSIGFLRWTVPHQIRNFELWAQSVIYVDHLSYRIRFLD